MKLSTIAFVLAGMLAFVAIAASTPAIQDAQAAPMAATKAAVVAASFAVILGTRVSARDTVELMVAATHRHEGRGVPPGPVDLHHYRGESAIQVSVDDVRDRSRRAVQGRAFL